MLLVQQCFTTAYPHSLQQLYNPKLLNLSHFIEAVGLEVDEMDKFNHVVLQEAYFRIIYLKFSATQVICDQLLTSPWFLH